MGEWIRSFIVLKAQNFRSFNYLVIRKKSQNIISKITFEKLNLFNRQILETLKDIVHKGRIAYLS